MDKTNKNNLIEDVEDFEEIPFDIDEDYILDDETSIPQSIAINFGTYQYDAVQSVLATIRKLCEQKEQLEEDVSILTKILDAYGIPLPDSINTSADSSNDVIDSYIDDDDLPIS